MRNWTKIKDYSDILFDFYNGIARITINRPEVYNAFRPQTNADRFFISAASFSKI